MNLRDFLELAQEEFRLNLFAGIWSKPNQPFTIHHALQQTAVKQNLFAIESMLSGIYPGWHRVAEYYLNFVSSPQFLDLLKEMFPAEMAEWQQLEVRRLEGEEDLSFDAIFQIIKLHSEIIQTEKLSVMGSFQYAAVILYNLRPDPLIRWLQAETTLFRSDSRISLSLNEVIAWFYRDLVGIMWQRHRHEMIAMFDKEALRHKRKPATV